MNGHGGGAADLGRDVTEQVDSFTTIADSAAENHERLGGRSDDRPEGLARGRAVDLVRTSDDLTGHAVG